MEGMDFMKSSCDLIFWNVCIHVWLTLSILLIERKEIGPIPSEGASATEEGIKKYGI